MEVEDMVVGMVGVMEVDMDTDMDTAMDTAIMGMAMDIMVGDGRSGVEVVVDAVVTGLATHPQLLQCIKRLSMWTDLILFLSLYPSHILTRSMVVVPQTECHPLFTHTLAPFDPMLLTLLLRFP
jgi:hypothetical protein